MCRVAHDIRSLASRSLDSASLVPVHANIDAERELRCQIADPRRRSGILSGAAQRRCDPCEQPSNAVAEGVSRRLLETAIRRAASHGTAVTTRLRVLLIGCKR